jgi:hypothetical protein
MSAVAAALFRDLGVECSHRLDHKGRGLEYIRDLHKVKVVFDLGNVHYCDTWPKPLEQRLQSSIRFNRAVPAAALVFLPSSWGPYRPAHRALLDELTKGAIVFGRDRYSVRCLNETLEEERAVLCPDLALLCEREDPAVGRQILLELGLSNEAPILGLIPNSRCVEAGITPLSDPAQYHCHLRAAVRWAVRNEYQVVGISHMVGTNRDARLLDELGIPVFQSDQPTQVRSVMANLSAAVCSRYHGLVNCLVHGVPPVSLGWHAKYRGIMDLFGLFDFDHPLEQSEGDLIARLDALSTGRAGLVRQLGDRLQTARNEIRGCMRSMSARIGGPTEVLANPVIVDDVAADNLMPGRPTRLQKLWRRARRSLF